MSEFFELGPIEWVRSLFSDADAESLFGWVLAAWLGVAIGAILLDRLSYALQGRSRPRLQRPPLRARMWRWKDEAPPEYVPVPSDAIHSVPSTSISDEPASIPLSRPTFAAAELPALDQLTGTLTNKQYWRESADDQTPIFGHENNTLLHLGSAPERYNPITRSIDTLERDVSDSSLNWPLSAPARVTVFEDKVIESATNSVMFGAANDAQESVVEEIAS